MAAMIEGSQYTKKAMATTSHRAPAASVAARVMSSDEGTEDAGDEKGGTVRVVGGMSAIIVGGSSCRRAASPRGESNS